MQCFRIPILRFKILRCGNPANVSCFGNQVLKLYFKLPGGEKFDVIFIDADKENYIHYYNLAMEGLLSSNGFILADNSMCAILYDSSDERYIKKLKI